MRITINKKMLFIPAIAFIASAVFLFYIESSYTHIQINDQFNRTDFPESIYFLYDIGVVDLNNDGFLDIFTSNHFAQQYLMIGDGAGNFNDPSADTHLSQDNVFPGIEDMAASFETNDTGVYIYWYKNVLYIQNNNSLKTGDIKGKIVFYSDVKIENPTDQGLEFASEKTESGATKTTIHFRLQAGEYLELKPELVAIPFKFAINKDYNLNKLYLGTKLINPDTHNFTVYLHDRHGMAWTDLDADGSIDVFIARGGLKGRMLTQPNQDDFADELLIHSDDGFSNIVLQAGLEKHGCSGHQAAWVDFNNDGLLDLYITCRRTGQPNQLYKQVDDLKFEEVAHQYGLDRQGDWLGPFLWLDFDHDTDQDLILEEDNKLWLYVNHKNTFTRKLIVPASGKASKFTVADYDLDGDQDIFAASSEKSILLVNTGDSFIPKDPSTIGLPSGAKTANWVDYDNDGLMDLHAVPGGIFRQQSGHTFRKTGLLEHMFGTSVEYARCTWFDMDNDGDRDLIMAVKYKPSHLHTMKNRLIDNKVYDLDWKMYLYENRNKGNNWLQIKLIGPENNHQALGTRVTVVNSHGSAITQVVGNSEGTHSSQGHNRLYFGFPGKRTPESIHINWPDNKIQLLTDPAINTLMTVEYE